ncbi:MAG: GGDEF domain-containing protein, partial [Candidatus Cloacimonetes bacterium]|nr:GGDEF domain-containing protein [Candidatus Cloacimonadota bacterium]
ASEEFYGFSKEEAIGKKMEDLIIPYKKRKTAIKLVDSWFKKGLEIYSREQVLMRKDNSPIVVHSSQVMLRNLDNEMELYSLDINITEKKKAEEALNESYKKLQQLARTDALTQLSNRRDILEKLEYEQIKFERSKETFSIAIGDLDDFKNVNDEYGHDCGDFVLKHVSNLMVDIVRKQDVLARYGGEEFMLLLPQTSLKGAYHIAELIRKKIAKFPITYKDKEVTITITFGVTLYNKKMSMNQCISKADKALYKGKAEGKNRVILAES